MTKPSEIVSLFVKSEVTLFFMHNIFFKTRIQKRKNSKKSCSYLVNEKGDLTESNPRSQKTDFTCQILNACKVHFDQF